MIQSVVVTRPSPEGEIEITENSIVEEPEVIKNKLIVGMTFKIPVLREGDDPNVRTGEGETPVR